MYLRNLVFVLILLMALSIMGGCAETVVDGACIALRQQFPFQVQKGDTTQTKKAAYKMNTAYGTACPIGAAP